MQYTIEKIERRLNEFTSADEIAAQCAILGIRGKVGIETYSCPLARITGYRVGFSEFFDDENSARKGKLPLAASLFAYNYTDRQYPFLRP